MPKKAQATHLENFFVSEGHRVLYNEITYLKKRIHLVEGERKANYESNEDIIKKNDTILKETKEKNKQLKDKRKAVTDPKRKYFTKIAELMGGEKKAFEFKDKSAREIIEILEYKIGALKNKLNLVDYKRIHYTKHMHEVLELEGTLKKKLVKKSSPHDPRIEELKATETSTAAMQMKTTEAENVRSRYKHMLGVLKDENFTQSIKLTELEHNIEKQHKEITRIESVLQDANRAKKCTKHQLLQVEEETIQEFSMREQELYEARMKLKIIRDKMETIGSKLTYPKFHIIHRDSSVTDGMFPSMTSLEQQDGAKASLTNIEAVYNELQELTGESDPKLLVERFEKQRKHSKELLRDEQVMKSAVRKAKLRKRFLVDKLEQLQYSGGLTREELNVKAEEITEEISTTTTERDRLDNIINEHTVMMEQMLTKLQEICQNNDLRPTSQPQTGGGITTMEPETTTSPLGNKILVILKHILQKTEQIVQEQQQYQQTVLSSTPLLSPASPLPPRRNTMSGNSEDENALGVVASSLVGGALSPSSQRFSSTGDISVTAPLDISGMGSRKPSVTDLAILDKLTVDCLLPPDISGAVSPMSNGTGFQLHIPEDGQPDIKTDKQRASYTSKSHESSEEEEAVTRNFVKRQSQILFEAKTRKGRFNTTAAPAPRHRRY